MADRFLEWVAVAVSAGALVTIWLLLTAFAGAILLLPVAAIWVLYNLGVWIGG